jgi:hypothetical protein
MLSFSIWFSALANRVVVSCPRRQLAQSEARVLHTKLCLAAESPRRTLARHSLVWSILASDCTSCRRGHETTTRLASAENRMLQLNV